MSNGDIAYELADLLADNGFGTLGDDIMVGQIDFVKNGIYLLNVAGDSNNYVPMQRSVVDIYAKNTSANAGITKLRNIKNLLDRMHSVNLGQNYIYSILLLGSIENIQRDNEYAKIMKITIEVMHRDKALIS